jgi:hypothetical protein
MLIAGLSYRNAQPYSAPLNRVKQLGRPRCCATALTLLAGHLVFELKLTIAWALDQS